ncbi:unnamed protein product [Malus baccata var. baccata]
MGQGNLPIPDLNKGVDETENRGDQLALVQFLLKVLGSQHQDMLKDRREGLEIEMRQPLQLFGAAIEPSVGGKGGSPKVQGDSDETFALTLASGLMGKI